MSKEPLQSLVNEILQYITRHPEAGDTVHGIACWWLTRQRYEESIERIQQALNLLQERGAVDRIELPDGNSFYRSKVAPVSPKSKATINNKNL